MSAFTAQEVQALTLVVEPVAGGEYLSFRLGAEEYGIEILRVQEIRGFEQPTWIAGAPESVCGVLNMWGAVVPVVDLRTQFGMEPRHHSLTATVVLSVNGQTVGVVVDSVSDVIVLGPDQIRPIPAFNGTTDTEHITGIRALRQGDQDRMLILMDIQQLLRKPDVGLAN